MQKKTGKQKNIGGMIMNVQILGTGCARCKKLEENTRKALNELSIDCIIEKVTELNDIMEYGIMITPGFAIDKQVKSSGRLLTVDQIKDLIKNEVKKNS
jgi:small redox-active disulfide protein 2